METITLNKTTPDLRNQLEFLIRHELFLTYNKFQRLPFYLVVITTFVIALVMMTDTDSYILLKVLSATICAFIWLAALVLLIVILIKRYNRNAWKNDAIKEYELNQSKIQFAYDQEKLYFFSEKCNSDIRLDYYKFYAIYKDSVFLIPERNLYESIFYSRTELGSEHFDLLTDIVSRTLIPIDKTEWGLKSDLR